MTDGFTHEIPQEFSDEDRWIIGRISLSRKSFIVLLAGGGMTYGMYKFFSLIDIPVLGVVLGVLLTIVAVFLTIFPIPETDYIKGGGLTLDDILLRRFVRRRNRIVYVKGIREVSKKKKG